MSDDDDEAREFQTKRQRLTKDQQTYGVFYEAYEDQRPSFGGGGGGRSANKKTMHAKMMNFKAGELINPNEKEVLIDVPKKKKKVSFAKQEKVHTFVPEEKPAMFTMESFLNSIGDDEEPEEQEQEESEESKTIEKVRPKKLEDHIKTSLKLYKYSEYGKVKTMKDYGLPENFGKQSASSQAPPKPKKTVEQLDLQHQYRQKYGMGYKMLAKMGFVAGGGLGKDGTGRTAPVEAVFQTALLVEDKQQPKAKEPVVVEQKHSSDEQTKPPLEKGIEELFEYFSQNEEVNSLLKHLKSEYERLQTLVDRQQTEQQRIQSKLDSFESSLIQNENERKMLVQSLDELAQIRQNLFDCEKYPHHALKFNIDLLLVKMTIEKLTFHSFESLYNEREQMAGQLFSLRDKLTRLYLQKERENIRNFSHDSELTKLLFEKVIDVEKFQQQAEMSEEDALKIRRFLRLVLEDCIVGPWLLPKMKGWQLSDHATTEQLINLCEVVIKLDKEVLLEPLDKYVYPMLNQYIGSFQLANPMFPHLVVFPWLTVIKPDKLHYQAMMMHLHALHWQPTEPLLLNCLRPWQEFLGRQRWYDLISFTIAPRLLQIMESFTISASQTDNTNLAKLKALMLYSPLLEVDHLQAILEDTLIKQLIRTYRSLRQRQPAATTQKWLEGWRRTLTKISCNPRIVQLFDQVHVDPSH